MSGLIKAIAKGVKKTFKAVKKVVKKVVKSKVFKAVAIAAAVVFTGGAALGALGATGASGLAASGLATASTVGSSLGTLGSIAGAIGSAGAAVGSVAGTIASGIGTWAAANPMLASTALQVGGQVIGGASQAKAERDAWDEDRQELSRNNNTQLNIRDRLAADNLSRRGATSPTQQNNYIPPNQQPVAQLVSRSQTRASTYSNPVNESLQEEPRSRSFYDPETDSYRAFA